VKAVSNWLGPTPRRGLLLRVSIVILQELARLRVLANSGVWTILVRVKVKPASRVNPASSSRGAGAPRGARTTREARVMRDANPIRA